MTDYLHRVGVSTELLGTEPQRYYELAAADAEAAALPTTPQHERYAGQRHSLPLLPAAPAGSDDNKAQLARLAHPSRGALRRQECPLGVPIVRYAR
ncbi:hypothetical protein [Dactylosporangium sp. CA-233914]|uniref:hypothetical protein n=1 Tax=Dactylosporangium sp. CA-233914 TaxID=3239934 RepID=UPI003D90D71A